MAHNGHEKVAVFYHSPCLDGAAAAWAAHEKWGNHAQYFGINHGNPEALRKMVLDHIDEETHLVFADFTPPRIIMDELADHAKSVTVYDHHASAITAMEGYENAKVKLTFDRERSGAALVFDALFPKKKRPAAIELAQMIDLEQTERKDFFARAAYVDSLPLTDMNEIITSMQHLNETPADQIIACGQAIRRYHATSIQKAMDSMGWSPVSILPDSNPIFVPIINANPQHLGREFSIRLRELAEKTAPGFTALSWYEDKGIVRVSVRTNGTPDAGKVAQHIGSHGLGGGGHGNSAAAQFTIEEFNSHFKRMTQQEVAEALASPAPLVIESPKAVHIPQTPAIVADKGM